MPASTAAERLAAWVYIRDTFFATVLGGWTVTNYIDTATDPDRFSLSNDVVDLVSGNTRTNHAWMINQEHGSGDFQTFHWRVSNTTSSSSSATDNINVSTGWSKTSAVGSLLTVVDPSHAGFKFMVSDENDRAFCITLNNKLFMFYLGVKEVYGWADDDNWWTGVSTGLRNFACEQPMYRGSTAIFAWGGTNQNSTYSDYLIPGIYYDQDTYYAKDHAYNRFPLVMTSNLETDDHDTALFGFSPATDVSWLRPVNLPQSGTENRTWFPNAANPYTVARQLNGDYVLFWKDFAGSTEPYALLNFGANDPS